MNLGPSLRRSGSWNPLLSFRSEEFYPLDPSLSKCKYRFTARDRDRKNMLAYNEFAYKMTKDDFKLQDRFQKNGQFSVACTRNRR